MIPRIGKPTRMLLAVDRCVPAVVAVCVSTLAVMAACAFASRVVGPGGYSPGGLSGPNDCGGAAAMPISGPRTTGVIRGAKAGAKSSKALPASKPKSRRRGETRTFLEAHECQ